MSQYSQIIYHLQEELMHFGLGVLTNFGLGVSGTKKKFIKILELYHLFIHTFLSQNVSISPNYMLRTCMKSTVHTFTICKLYQYKLVLLFFSHPVTNTNLTILIDAI